MSVTGRIVAINDDPIQLRLLGRILEAGGHEVRTYLGASEALAGLAARSDVDLFVVDLHMPGIDGWKFCRLLRSSDFPVFNGTPILVVSATFTGADVEAITADLGANAFLSVPYQREELLGFAADLLQGIRPRMETTVMIVEDDDAVRRSVTRVFEADGFRVTQAASALEAVERWSAKPADIVLLDYHLPDGTCEELIDRFKGPAAATVVLVMTGDTDPSLPVSLLAQGADGYVRKPLDPVLLVELARKAQRERSLLRVESILEKRTQELRASERRYRSLFETIPDAVLVLDEADRVAELNAVTGTSLGREPQSLLGTHVLELVPPEVARDTAKSLEEIRTGGASRFETRLAGPGGTSVEVEVTGVTTEGHHGRGMLLVARDLTERKKVEAERRRLEEQVQHAQRLESLGVLAGGIAHDFNNLLVGILGNASLALMDAPDGGTLSESIRQIETAARRAAELTQQILTFSGKGKVVTREVDLSQLVREMGQLLEPAVSKKARVSYRLSRVLPALRGDPGQLRQVVMNLIMNASDALEGKPGAIDVETGVTDLTVDELRAHYLGEASGAGRYVYLEVYDDGCGMDAATQQRMFDPFFTTKFTGRGLGLAATLGIVRAHAGAVRVESEPGKGTRFRLIFPAIEDVRRGDEDADRGGERPWSEGGRILVVDDEPSVRNLARAALLRQGFDVLEAGDGREGLEIVRTDPRIDLVLLDLMMPELDGEEVLEALRRHAPALPVILSSGYPPEAVPKKVFATGPTGFIRKPYGPSELVEHVSRLLRRGRADAAAGGHVGAAVP